MKVIFLDVDGVLNSDYDWYATHGQMVVANNILGICKTRIKKLKFLADQTDGVIVLVSTWKNDYDAYIHEVMCGYPKEQLNVYGRYLYQKLRKYGIHIFDTTITDEYHLLRRGEGIKHWLKRHEGCVQSYVILDDELFDYVSTGLMVRVVHTSSSVGLQDQDIDKAIQILNTPLQ